MAIRKSVLRLSTLFASEPGADAAKRFIVHYYTQHRDSKNISWTPEELDNVWRFNSLSRDRA